MLNLLIPIFFLVGWPMVALGAAGSKVPFLSLEGKKFYPNPPLFWALKEGKAATFNPAMNSVRTALLAEKEGADWKPVVIKDFVSKAFRPLLKQAKWEHKVMQGLYKHRDPEHPFLRSFGVFGKAGKGRSEGQWSLVMERGPGSLLDYLRPGTHDQAQPLPLEQVLTIMEGLVYELRILHEELGIVHGDLKPGNILLDPRTLQVILIDFGFSFAIETEFEYARMFCGTPLYLAPEVYDQTKEQQMRTPKRDYFALGAILYQMVYGGDLLSKNYQAYKITNRRFFEDDRSVLKAYLFDPNGYEHDHAESLRSKNLTEIDRLAFELMHPNPELRPTRPEVEERLAIIRATLAPVREPAPLPEMVASLMQPAMEEAMLFSFTVVEEVVEEEEELQVAREAEGFVVPTHTEIEAAKRSTRWFGTFGSSRLGW